MQKDYVTILHQWDFHLACLQWNTESLFSIFLGVADCLFVIRVLLVFLQICKRQFD